jgi:hypothetical protein
VIIPARPGVFDVNAVQETIQICRSARKPYAVVLNGARIGRQIAGCFHGMLLRLHPSAHAGLKDKEGPAFGHLLFDNGAHLLVVIVGPHQGAVACPIE